MNAETGPAEADSGTAPSSQPGSAGEIAPGKSDADDGSAGVSPEVSEMVSSFLAIQQHIGPAPNPLLARADESHLHKILDSEDVTGISITSIERAIATISWYISLA